VHGLDERALVVRLEVLDRPAVLLGHGAGPLNVVGEGVGANAAGALTHTIR